MTKKQLLKRIESLEDCIETLVAHHNKVVKRCDELEEAVFDMDFALCDTTPVNNPNRDSN